MKPRGIRVELTPLPEGGWEADIPDLELKVSGSTLIGALEDLVAKLKFDAERAIDEALRDAREAKASEEVEDLELPE